MKKTILALGAFLLMFTSASAQAQTQPVKKKHAVKGHTKTSASKKSTRKTGQTAAVAATAGVTGGTLYPISKRWPDRTMDGLSNQFLNAYWRLVPERAIAEGKFDTAATMTIPDQAYRTKQLAFITDWQAQLGDVKASQLSPRQHADLVLLNNKLDQQRWQLSVLREYSWNPALYNIAAPIDDLLHTDYAALPQRLRTILRRLESVPAYYDAARANLTSPTREHIALAITQGPGVSALLDELGKTAQDSILNAREKLLYSERIDAAHKAVDAYLAWLAEQDKALALTPDGGHSFRLGKDLYLQKFALENQSSIGAEQMYQRAVTAREELLVRMDGLAEQLWGKIMGNTAKPADRNDKIAMLISALSEQHVARDDFLPEIRREIPQLQAWVNEHNLLRLDPDKPLQVRAMPSYEIGLAAASIQAPGPYRPQDPTYYNVMPLDGLAPADAEERLREYNRWMLPIMNMHEAIPGHYTQLVYANKSPSLVTSIFGNDAMKEGWAVYSERMMLDSGYGDNAPELWLMYSKWNLRAVTDLILDYSVHVLGMTHDQAITMLTKQAFQSPTEAEQKWHEAQLTSVKLSSYFTGYSEITDLRDARKQALGARFSLKAFNEQFLSYGSAPVKLIKEMME